MVNLLIFLTTSNPISKLMGSMKGVATHQIPPELKRSSNTVPTAAGLKISFFLYVITNFDAIAANPAKAKSKTAENSWEGQRRKYKIRAVIIEDSELSDTLNIFPRLIFEKKHTDVRVSRRIIKS